jgi:hypothetical protein
MITCRTLVERLADARLAQLAPAVEATLKPLFPDVSVVTLAGKIDVSDVIEGSIFQPPVIAVTLTRWRGPVDVGGGFAVPVELAAYVVTEEMAIGDLAVRREVVAHALSMGLLEILADLDTPRWGLDRISSPEDAEARPIFTAHAYAQGVAYYAVTWRQHLLGLGTDPLARIAYSGVESVDEGVATAWPPDLSGEPV